MTRSLFDARRWLLPLHLDNLCSVFTTPGSGWGTYSLLDFWGGKRHEPAYQIVVMEMKR